MKSTKKRNRKPSESSLTRHGLSLPAGVLKALHKRGVYCAPGVSMEHQHLGGRYVLRGVESGGAVSDMGRACAFVAPDGSPVPWLQSLRSLAVNGRHAIFLAESLVRLEMLRSLQSYELVITSHTLVYVPQRRRPEIATNLVFRGKDGLLPFDLWKEKHRALRGMVSPTFYDRAGEVIQLPRQFEDAVRELTGAVCCIGCQHTHLGIPPVGGGGIKKMPSPIQVRVTVGEPNWAPLVAVIPPAERANFMYMGRAGEIELYKHRLTRRYLNIARDAQSFYQYLEGGYVEITREAALDHLRR